MKTNISLPPFRPASLIPAAWLGLSLLPDTAGATDFASLPGLLPPQQSLAAALDRSCATAGGALAARCGELQALDDTARRRAVQTLTPFQFLPQTGMPIKLRIAQVDTRARLNALRENQTSDTGGGAGDLEYRDGDLSVFLQGKFQASGKSRGLGSFDADSFNTTAGLDYRFSDKLVMGLALGYTQTNTVMISSQGDMDTNALMGSFFGNYYLPGDFYVDWAATFTGFDNDVQRNLSYSGFSGAAYSRPDAEQYGMAISLGKDFSYREWLINPYVRFEYINLHLDGYGERGGLGLDYVVDSQSDKSFITIPGMQLSHNFSLPWGVLTPSIRFEWEHQHLNDERLVRIRLADAAAGPGNFSLSTGRPDRDYYNLGGSLTATLPGGIGAFLRYEARLAQAPISSQIVEIGVRVPF